MSGVEEQRGECREWGVEDQRGECCEWRVEEQREECRKCGVEEQRGGRSNVVYCFIAEYVFSPIFHENTLSGTDLIQYCAFWSETLDAWSQMSIGPIFCA